MPCTRSWWSVRLAAPRSLSGPRLWYANMALDAAEHGQGIAIANAVLAESALAAGSLVAVTATEVTLDPYILVTDRRRWNDPMIARLREWLIAELARFQGMRTVCSVTACSPASHSDLTRQAR